MAVRDKVKFERAKQLYTRDRLSKKEVCERVKINSRTLKNWIVEYNWEDLRKSLLVTKEEQLKRLYDQLDWITTHIETRKIIYDVPDSLKKPIITKDAKGNETITYPTYDETDFPILIGNVATSKEADAISKITTSIKRLEDETSIGDVVTVAKNFIAFVRQIDFDFAKTATEYFDLFINKLLKDG